MNKQKPATIPPTSRVELIRDKLYDVYSIGKKTEAIARTLSDIDNQYLDDFTHGEEQEGWTRQVLLDSIENSGKRLCELVDEIRRALPVSEQPPSPPGVKAAPQGRRRTEPLTIPRASGT